MVLLAADGLNDQDIGARLRITRQKAGRWRNRFVEQGIGGIATDAPRSGRLLSIRRHAPFARRRGFSASLRTRSDACR